MLDPVSNYFRFYGEFPPPVWTKRTLSANREIGDQNNAPGSGPLNARWPFPPFVFNKFASGR